MEWYLKVLKNYVGFSGRARRKEFWMFTLISSIISIVLSNILGSINGIGGLFTALGGLYSLGVFLPTIAVGIRRLHDIGKSGKWLLIALTGIGAIWLIVLFAKEGTPGENSYGSDPKEEIV